MSVLSERINQQFSEGDATRDAGLQTPYTIERKDNILYGQDPTWQILDVYYPKGTHKKLPVIINVHGGGWVYGTKEVYQYYTMFLASQGFAVINYTYRLAPQSRFPSSLEDTNLVIEWMFKHQDDYPFDTKHVFMVGDSAGAHLLGQYCNFCTHSDYAKHFNFKAPHHFIPKAIALNCGVYDLFKVMKEDKMTAELMEDYLGKDASKKSVQLADVVSHMNTHFPPTFLMSSTGDFLLTQYPVMEQKLKEYHIPYIAKVYGDEKNQLPHVFHCNMYSEDAAYCNQDECDFFKSFL